MSLTYKLNPEIRFIETQCKGNVTFDEVMNHFQELETDTSLPKRLDVLLDLSEVTSVPDSGQMQNVALAIGRLKGRVEWGSCAIIVNNDVLFGMSRILEVFVEGLFTHIKVFRSRKEAEYWIDKTRSPAA